jgi:hypothetical protein
MGQPVTAPDEAAQVAAWIEVAAGIEHERREYLRCVDRIDAALREVDLLTDRRLEAFGNLSLFGRSPFVPEWQHHLPPSDPATNAAWDALVADDDGDDREVAA